MLYPSVGTKHRKPEPDWRLVHRELSRKGVTLQCLWLEYRAQYDQADVVLRQPHRAVETVPIIDGFTGEVQQAAVFVGALGASNYTYAEVVAAQDLDNWVGAHIHMFEFFCGVTEVVVPDHLKSGVSLSCRYEPGLNPTYREMEHYGTVVIPARPKEPRGNAKTEQSVCPTVADAILDRLLHHAHRIVLKGETMRKMTNDIENTG